MLSTRREATVTVKGGSAVHPDSGLADVAHVLVEARHQGDRYGPRTHPTDSPPADSCIFPHRLNILPARRFPFRPRAVSLPVQGKVTYSVTMSLADLAKGKNSYYVLQLIENDCALRCRVRDE